MRLLAVGVLVLMVFTGQARAYSDFAEPLFGKQSHQSQQIDEEGFGDASKTHRR